MQRTSASIYSIKKEHGGNGKIAWLILVLCFFVLGLFELRMEGRPPLLIAAYSVAVVGIHAYLARIWIIKSRHD